MDSDSDSDNEDVASGEKKDPIYCQSLKTSVREIEGLILQINGEMKSLKEVIDRVDLMQRQDNKELQSQWSQLKLIVEPAVDNILDLLRRKVGTQEGENHRLLKQLIEVKKQHVVLKAEIEESRGQAAVLRKEIG